VGGGGGHGGRPPAGGGCCGLRRNGRETRGRAVHACPIRLSLFFCFFFSSNCFLFFSFSFEAKLLSF
jgi:hypothetical protein